MGTYDEVEVDGKQGQVKAWGDGKMRSLTKGDWVPQVTVVLQHWAKTYSIKMQEGGYVNVVDQRIESWTDAPQSKFVLDKWGQQVDALWVTKRVAYHSVTPELIQRTTASGDNDGC